MRMCDLRYGDVSAWPPVWTSALPSTRFFAGQVDGVLRSVAVDGAGVEITFELEDVMIVGRLRWDGPPTAGDLKLLLDRYAGRPLSAVANMFVRDLRQEDGGLRLA